MALRVVHVRCEVAEIRRSGGIPIRISGGGSAAKMMMVVPRSAVAIGSISKGITGSVAADLVKDLGEEVVVDIPDGSQTGRRLRVEKAALQPVSA